MNEAMSASTTGTLTEAAATTGGAAAIGYVRAPVEIDPELKARLREVEEERQRKESLRARIAKERRVLFPILGVALLCLPNFGRAKVVGHSMEPLLSPGDTLVLLKTYRLFSPLKPGDVVVIRKKRGRLEGEDLVKRIVFIQNETGDAPWPQTIKNARGVYATSRLFPREALGYEKVPARHAYVLGDNVWNSTDSRDADIGAISQDEIIGKVINR